MDGEEKRLLEESQEHAKKNGFKLNPDPKVIEFIIKGLLRNKKKHGERYCPCRRVKGNPKVDKKIICPCIYHKDEIEEQGHCHCFLFVK